jgi:hypothetical protein
MKVTGRSLDLSNIMYASLKFLLIAILLSCFGDLIFNFRMSHVSTSRFRSRIPADWSVDEDDKIIGSGRSLELILP